VTKSSLGFEDLLSPYLPLQPTELDQQSELDVFLAGLAAGQEQQQEADSRSGESSAPESEQDGGIVLVDGSEPGDETDPGSQAESELTADVTAVEPEPYADQGEPEAGEEQPQEILFKPGKSSAPVADQDGEILLVEGGDPGALLAVDPELGVDAQPGCPDVVGVTGLGFLEGLGSGSGAVLFPGLEDLVSFYVTLLSAESDQQPELDVVLAEPGAGQEQEPAPDPEHVESSSPQGEQDAEIELVDGSEPGDETDPGPEAESELTADVNSLDSDPAIGAGPEVAPASNVTPRSHGFASAASKDAGGNPLVSGVVVSSRSRTQVRIAGLDRLFGTGRDDRIRGSRRAEFVVGRRGGDKLTGGNGPDLFGLRWGDSRIGAPDWITDFSFGEDKISLFGRQSRLHGQPLRLSRAADNRTATTLQQLAVEVFADADGRRPGNQALRRRSAVLVQATNRSIRGTYLLINNNNSGLSLRRDLMVNITGFSGELPDFGRVDAATVFG
jgi:hypothetical protein